MAVVMEDTGRMQEAIVLSKLGLTDMRVRRRRSCWGGVRIVGRTLPWTTAPVGGTLPAFSLPAAACWYGLGGIVVEDSQVACLVSSCWVVLGGWGYLSHTTETRAGSSVSPQEAGAKHLTDSNVFRACHPRDSEFGFISLSFWSSG